MKSLKFLLTFFVVMTFFAVGISNAQNKTVETESFDFEGVMDCTDDYVWGVETMVYTTWDYKYQVRGKGEYVGASGKHYTWSLVFNVNMKKYIPGKGVNRTEVSTSVIECEGVPIAIYKVRFHATMNANGEMTVYRDWNSGDGWVCL